MIAHWPPKPRYEAEKQLPEAINATAQANALADFMASTYASGREAVERLQVMQDAVAKALADIDALHSTQTDNVSNTHLTNIRDDLAALIDESDRP